MNVRQPLVRTHSELDAAFLEAVTQIHDRHVPAGATGAQRLRCYEISRDVGCAFWIDNEVGYYSGPEVRRAGGARGQSGGGYGHEWNRLEDGTIVDGSADQFGDAPVRVITPYDLRQLWYHAETGAEKPTGYFHGAPWRPAPRQSVSVLRTEQPAATVV